MHSSMNQPFVMSQLPLFMVCDSSLEEQQDMRMKSKCMHIYTLYIIFDMDFFFWSLFCHTGMFSS